MGVPLTAHLTIISMLLLGVIAAFLFASRVQYERRQKRRSSLAMSSEARIIMIAAVIITSGFALVGAWEAVILETESKKLIVGLYTLAAIVFVLGAHHVGIWWGNRMYEGRRSMRVIR